MAAKAQHDRQAMRIKEAIEQDVAARVAAARHKFGGAFVELRGDRVVIWRTSPIPRVPRT